MHSPKGLLTAVMALICSATCAAQLPFVFEWPVKTTEQDLNTQALERAIKNAEESAAWRASHPEPIDSLINLWIDFPLTYSSYRNYNIAPDFTPDTDVTTKLQINKNSGESDELILPFWMKRNAGVLQLLDATRYKVMITKPEHITYVASLLPDPPKLTDRKPKATEEIIADIPVEIDEEIPPTIIDDISRINWLHTFNGSLQFSQAYLSPNWYQGGHNNLALFANLFWNVKLNEVYHPKLLLDNTISYKLGLNSTPQDKYHNYSVSEDLLQWNFKFGVKAFNNWFYSFTSQFKTQILNTYGEDSPVRKASFMSPGSLTLGLGMTYSATNKPKTLKFNASISPISYNLNTSIDSKVDPTQFGIDAGAKTKSEIGSNAELTAEWSLASNISWRSRLFMFTNYTYFLGDWENTINFTINRFLSTQIYVHLRYDSSTEIADVNETKRWRYWMLKEILSFGFAYTFSTK